MLQYPISLISQNVSFFVGEKIKTSNLSSIFHNSPNMNEQIDKGKQKERDLIVHYLSLLNMDLSKKLVDKYCFTIHS